MKTILKITVLALAMLVLVLKSKHAVSAFDGPLPVCLPGDTGCPH